MTGTDAPCGCGTPSIAAAARVISRTHMDRSKISRPGRAQSRAARNKGSISTGALRLTPVAAAPCTIDYPVAFDDGGVK
jgi:hypothetical protein